MVKFDDETVVPAQSSDGAAVLVTPRFVPAELYPSPDLLFGAGGSGESVLLG